MHALFMGDITDIFGFCLTFVQPLYYFGTTVFIYTFGILSVDSFNER